MKALVYHVLVVVHYFNFNLRSAQVLAAIAADDSPMSENWVVIFISLCTIWNVVCQEMYFLASVVSDVMRLTSTSKDVRKASALEDITTSFFTRIVFPFAVLISVNFWVMLTLDPANLDEYHMLDKHITAWDNHTMHTIIVVLVIIEILITHKPYPPNSWGEMTKTLVIHHTYYLSMPVLQRYSSIWIYPFFGWFRWYHWLAFIVLNNCLVCLSYQTGKFLSKAVWGEVEEDSHKNHGHIEFPKLTQNILGKAESLITPTSVGQVCYDKVSSISSKATIENGVRLRSRD